MKRLIAIITLMLVILPAGATFATIEKEKNTGKKTQVIQPGDSTGTAGENSESQLIPQEEPGTKHPQGYDDFVDKNNNGIDDRAEKKNENIKINKPPVIKSPEVLKPRTLIDKTTRRTKPPDDSVVKKKSK